MKSVFALGAVAAALLTATAAQAVPELRFVIDGVPVAACVDNAACDANAAVGVINASYSDIVNGFFVNTAIGVTQPIFTGAPTLMDLLSVSVSSSNAGVHAIEMLFSDTGFAGPVGVAGSFGGTLTGAGASVSAYAYHGAGLFDVSNALGVIGPFGAGGAFAGSFSASPVNAANYSLTQRIVVTTSGTAQTVFSGDFELKVPEPGTLALVGVALLGLGALRRRAK